MKKYFFEADRKQWEKPTEPKYLFCAAARTWAIAETEEEAREFLEDCLAVVVPSIAHVRKYLDESGMDVMGLTDEEVADAAEVFALPDGTFLIVEG